MSGGLVLVLAGVWVLAQVTRGEVLERLGVISYSKERLEEMKKEAERQKAYSDRLTGKAPQRSPQQQPPRGLLGGLNPFSPR